uniref:Uncharacterized protein n=1 Tax=viral metagenome TaxID=1070528 RepID=A0A6M3IYW8_9ZZZZ
MSRVYLEALEVVPNGETPEFIRVDITGKTDAEVASIKADVVAIMNGKTYLLRKHFCGHEDGLACRMIEWT